VRKSAVLTEDASGGSVTDGLPATDWMLGPKGLVPPGVLAFLADGSLIATWSRRFPRVVAQTPTKTGGGPRREIHGTATTEIRHRDRRAARRRLAGPRCPGRTLRARAGSATADVDRHGGSTCGGQRRHPRGCGLSPAVAVGSALSPASSRWCEIRSASSSRLSACCCSRARATAPWRRARRSLSSER
jgi:hypothetical protein